MSVFRRVECVTGEGGSSSGLIGPASIWVAHSRTWHSVGKANLFWALWVCRQNRNYPAFIVRPDLDQYCLACPLCRREWVAEEMPPEGGQRSGHWHQDQWQRAKGDKGQGRGRERQPEGGGHGGTQWEGHGGQWRDHRYHPYGAPYTSLPTARNKQNDDQLQQPDEASMGAWPPQPPPLSDEELKNVEEWCKQKSQDGLLQTPPEPEEVEEDWSEKDAEAWLESAAACAAATGTMLNGLKTIAGRKDDHCGHEREEGGRSEAERASPSHDSSWGNEWPGDSTEAASLAMGAGVQLTTAPAVATRGDHCCDWGV